MTLEATIGRIGPLDADAMTATLARLDRLTKPPGSLGRLESLAIQLAGIRGEPTPPIDRPAIVVFAGDHGVAARGVSAYPSDVTAQMVANFLGGGAAIDVLAGLAGARLIVVDVGVAGPLPPQTGDDAPGPRLIAARVADGTADFTIGPAMTRGQALDAIEVGRTVVDGRVGDGVDVLGVGEMGIGNTTAASALVAALTGRRVDEVTGRGTGVDDDGLRRKVEAIETGLARHRPDPGDPIGTLAAVGGLEIAGLVGAIAEAAARRIPVVLDGFISGAAALAASRLAPDLPSRLIAAHRSVEPGHRIVLERLGLEPLFELGLRLGEGSGAALALPLIRAAAAIPREMATFESAGVSDRSAALPV
jgi:nicotinate-nucleotide--dimethylbenzimidazole phosphoribosyltransferase